MAFGFPAYATRQIEISASQAPIAQAVPVVLAPL